ncbi:PTS sugar transporter subunit IIA [Pasteurella skyensis]|uniref:PTS sugar transporter subunit IIA n=1 Tax=Phocoenobacter skyensis TaxID=97481 RepID=A0AAJ6P0W2_9PAST|nr:PTS sugar transporter subunit IIA [Pasteurella skyensis]MDP8163037.1 PTS sugar transporter subunit IIA [Pasteurella skyensis]MDP8171444.1 PTS sugar transporter subunit IIA [Pasteurella skyensis]MDP8173102.1 PTS sugar transporter subunit IIA [Pasteurella skyensis]MDP8175638.1 PTS sugar transporter subunit IIA [Pasteurella skyensis]MDP8176325.1 PTS sugar transporter subunit IIA [Pasteurella skyensis]
MKLTKYLKPELVRLGVHLSSKKRALEVIGTMAADYLVQQSLALEDNLSAEECFSCLCKREKLGSTCINYGIAAPHTKFPNWQGEEPIAIFLQLENSIDYETAENKEIDLIFAVIFPDQENEEYKSDFQKIVTILNNKQLSKLLRTTKSVEDIWSVFDNADVLLEQKNKEIEDNIQVATENNEQEQSEN